MSITRNSEHQQKNQKCSNYIFCDGSPIESLRWIQARELAQLVTDQNSCSHHTVLISLGYIPNVNTGAREWLIPRRWTSSEKLLLQSYSTWLLYYDNIITYKGLIENYIEPFSCDESSFDVRKVTPTNFLKIFFLALWKIDVEFICVRRSIGGKLILHIFKYSVLNLFVFFENIILYYRNVMQYASGYKQHEFENFM